MTGLLQIFDRYKVLSRSKSAQKKVTSSNGEQAQGAGRDPSCIPFAYNMFQDESAQRRATLDGQGYIAQAEVNREPRRSSIDNSEVMLAKALANSKDPPTVVESKPQPARTSLDARPKPRLSFYFKEEIPVAETPLEIVKEVPVASVTPVVPVKEATLPTPKEPPRNSFSGLLQRRNSDPTVVASRLSVDGKISGKDEKEKKLKDFRGRFKASFLRKDPKVNSQESPGGSTGTSFDLKDGDHLKGSFSELAVEEKECLESVADLFGLNGLAADDGDKSYRRFIESPKGWIESRDGSTPRLTVELKEGPQLTRKDDQRGLMNNVLEETGLLEKFSILSLNGSKELKKMDDSIGLWNEQKDKAHASVDGRDPPRLSQTAKAAVPVVSVEGRPNPRQSSSVTPSSVHCKDIPHCGPSNHGDGRNANRAMETSNHTSPRRDNSRAASPRRESTWENDLEGSRWKASSVVARLMGLDDLPNFDVVPPLPAGMSPARECKSPQKGFYYIHPEESPHPQSDEFYNLVYESDEVQAPRLEDASSQMRKPYRLPQSPQVNLLASPKLRVVPFLQKDPEIGAPHTPASPKQQPNSSKHHMIESMPQVLKHSVEHRSSTEGLLNGDMDHRLRQLGLKNSIHERKTLKQILEAMHLKGLLHPPRHMDSEGKHSFSRQDHSQTVAKSLFQDPKGFPSTQPTGSLKTDLFDLDYKDIPKFSSAQNLKGSKQSVPDGGKPSLRGRNFVGEASIVVMKPLNTKPTSKILIVKPSPVEPQSKEMESMPAKTSSLSRKLATAPATRSAVEKEESIPTSTGVSLKTKTAAAPVKHKPRSRSVEPRKHEKVEEPSATATTRQRRERIAARTAKVASDGGEAHSWETSKPTRSTSSPPVAKSFTATKEMSSAKPIPPSKSAFGSSISRTTDGKSRVEPIKDKEEIKSTTQITRRTKSSRELTKERKTTEQEPLKVLSRSRSDSRLVPSPAERASSPEHSSKPKGSADVVVLCSKKMTGRIDRVSDERARSTVPFVDKVGSNNILREEIKIEEHKEEQCLSTASSRIECQDNTPDTSPMRAPIVVLSPPFSLPESWKLKPKRHIAERASDELLDRHKSRAESAIKRTQSDPLHYRGSRSGVSPDSRHQLDKSGLDSGLNSENLSEVCSQSQGVSVKKLLADAENNSCRLAEGAEQPSPVSILDNVHFQEGDCTPSPKSAKPGSVSLQDGTITSDRSQEDLQKNDIPITPVSPLPGLTGDPLKDLIYTVACSLDLDDQESYLNKPTLEIQVPYVNDMTPAPFTSSVPSSLNTKEDERAYVSHIMIASGIAAAEANAPREWPTSGHLIDADYFDQLEECLELRESARKLNVYLSGEERTVYLKEALDRRLLFDSVNNILERRLQPYLNPQPWGSEILRRRPMGAELIQEVWQELQRINARALDDESLYTILQKDFTQRGEKWVNFSIEIGEIGTEIEEMIFEELVDAAVQEFTDQCADKL